MELIAIVAVLAWSVVLGVIAARAILELMFLGMTRARTAQHYAISRLMKEATGQEAHPGWGP